MGQAKLRAKEIAELKNPLSGLIPVTDTDTVKIYQVKNLDKFKDITGRLPYEFENMEYIGPQISDQMVGGDSQKELYIGTWKDMVVEVIGRKGKGSKEYFAIRFNLDDVVVSRPAYGDTLTLTGIEAAFARFALSANSISWYAASPENKGVVRISPFAYIKGLDAAEYYHMAMYAAGELGMTNVYRYLD
jgi:hypothetical protein